MLIMVEIEVLQTRAGNIGAGYRPDWTSSDKPDYNCGRLWLPVASVAPGGTSVAIIEPLKPEGWGGIKPGSVLEAKEGLKSTVRATVKSVLQS